jgi:hypothetical protein
MSGIRISAVKDLYFMDRYARVLRPATVVRVNHGVFGGFPVSFACGVHRIPTVYVSHGRLPGCHASTPAKFRPASRAA